MPRRPPLRPFAALAVALFLVAVPQGPARASCGAESCPLDNSALGPQSRRLFFEVSFQQVLQDQVLVRDQSGNPASIYTAGGEVKTRSRVTMAKAHYSFGPRALISATLPFVNRLHQHVTVAGVPEPELREWQYSGLGDTMLLGSWNAFRIGSGPTPLSVSVQGGVKLPTGRTDVPDIMGEVPEPHARPGTGSTDLLAGAQLVKLVALPTPSASSLPTAFFASGLYMHTGEGTDNYRVGGWSMRTSAWAIRCSSGCS